MQLQQDQRLLADVRRVQNWKCRKDLAGPVEVEGDTPAIGMFKKPSGAFASHKGEAVALECGASRRAVRPQSRV